MFSCCLSGNRKSDFATEGTKNNNYLEPPRTKEEEESLKQISALKYSDLDVCFVDCDDTIYFNNWQTAIRLKNKIANYTTSRFNLDESYAWQLYKKHGTALRGLINENLIAAEHIEEYLRAVHTIPLSEISQNLELRKMLLNMNVKRWIFTASTREHAKRCMIKVGVEDLFEGIIDCRDANLVTKHDPTSFKAAMEKANVTDPTRCLLLDDSVPNIVTAKSLGFKTCLVGLYERETGNPIVCPEADYKINRLQDLQIIMPGLFISNKKDRRFSTIGGRKLSVLINRIVSKKSFLDGEGFDDSQQEGGDQVVIINKPRVVFVLGPPGSGKGTQCAMAKEEFSCLHLSAGDLLRAEQDSPNSEFGDIIREHIKSGTLVPADLTINLLIRAIGNSPRVLVDGFPRSLDNLEAFIRLAGDRFEISGVLYYEALDEEKLVERILERSKTSGRADDDVTVLKKRFVTMHEQTLPVIKRFENIGIVRRIDALREREEVWASTEMALDGFWQKPHPKQ